MVPRSGLLDAILIPGRGRWGWDQDGNPHLWSGGQDVIQSLIGGMKGELRGFLTESQSHKMPYSPWVIW